MANRRERFKKLYPKRLKNAVWNIQSIGKLSARTNYIYENKEVDEILLTLIFEIKGVMVKFGLGSTDMSSVFKTETEKKGPAFKEEMKITLTPLLTSLTLLQYADIDSESEMLGYGIGIILLNIGIYFVAPAVLIMKVRSLTSYNKIPKTI